MLVIVLLFSAQVPQLVTHESRAAAPWTERFKGRCGSQVLEIVRPIRPVDASPRLLINGAPVRGNTHALEQELHALGAAYRFQMLCGGRVMQLRWVRGLFDGRGHVNYRVGSAEFRSGIMLISRSEEATETAFWYR